jgi:uncharacterized membrane protein
MRSAGLAILLVLAACNSGQPDADSQGTNAAPSQAASAAPSPSSAAPEPEQRLQALGTEPFWSVYVEDQGLRYTTPENLKGTRFPARRTTEGEAQVWSGTYEGGPFTLRIAPGTCSDGMSDTVYPYSAQVTLAGEIRKGCARPQ